MLKLTNHYLLLVTILLMLLSTNSCRKLPKNDDNSVQPPSRVPDYTTTVLSSISGFVSSSIVEPAGAIVQYGNKTTQTDQFGYFEIKDANVVRDAAQLTVTKDNFETGYKTFQINEGKPIFTQIHLSAFSGGVFSAAAGTNMNFHGLSANITVAANSLINESTNSMYSDFVRSLLSFRDFRDERFDENMPGSLLGLDSSGKLKLLTIHNYGNIIFRGMNGEKLKLAPGKTATLKFYLTAQESTPNPASIQLWHYDPSKGFWQQKGRVGVVGTYDVNFQINELGYFALATADDYVQVTGRLVDKMDKPIPFTGTFLVPKPTEQHRPVWYYSNEDGYFSGYVKENSQQLIQINGKCTPPIYSKAFTAAQTNVPLGNVVISDERVVTVKATLKGCGGTKVTNGYIQFVDQVRHKANSEGVVEFNTIVCNFTYPNIAMYAIETPTAQISDMLVPPLKPGYNDIGDLSVCGTQSTIRFSCRLIDNTGNPLPDLFVRIAPVTDLSNYFRVKSIANGLVSTEIYKNRNYQLTVYGSLQCNAPLFTTNFSTVNRDTSIGNLTMAALTTATITGTVVDCNNNPLSNGYVVIFKDEKGFKATLNNTGSFTITLPVCNAGGPETMFITPFNSFDLLPGNTLAASITSGTNTVSLNGCYNPAGTKEYVSYAVDNTLYGSYVQPQDSIVQLAGSYPDQMFISVQRKTFYGLIYATGFSIFTTGIAVGSDLLVEDVYIPEIDAGLSGPALARITEYGPVGGYIAGTIQTNVMDRNFKNYAVRLSFRVKRNF